MTAAPAPGPTGVAIPSLEDYLDAEAPEGAGREGFEIETPEQAAWAARKLRKLKAQADEVDTTAKHEAARIEAWRQECRKPIDDAIGYFEGLLTFHLEGLHRDGDERKTLKAGPGVEVKARKQPDTWAFEDDTFIEWAEEHAPELVRTTKAVDKPAAKASLGVRKDGAVVGGEGVVPGVTVKPGSVKFSVAYTDK